jgi:hypothetical protein
MIHKSSDFIQHSAHKPKGRGAKQNTIVTLPPQRPKTGVDLPVIV